MCRNLLELSNIQTGVFTLTAITLLAKTEIDLVPDTHFWQMLEKNQGP